MFRCICSNCLCIHRSFTLSIISCRGARIRVSGVRNSCEMLMKKRSFISFTSFCFSLSMRSIWSCIFIFFRIQKYRRMKVKIIISANTNSKIAHHVLYHTGRIIIFSSVGFSFHFPLLLEAFTRKR